MVWLRGVGNRSNVGSIGDPRRRYQPKAPCRIGRVAWIQGNFWGCNSARGMPCMSAKPPRVIESRVDRDVCKSPGGVQRRRCDTRQVDAQ